MFELSLNRLNKLSLKASSSTPGKSSNLMLLYVPLGSTFHGNLVFRSSDEAVSTCESSGVRGRQHISLLPCRTSPTTSVSLCSNAARLTTVNDLSSIHGPE